jgi:D-alanyl-D-alanine carboxypeptidase
MMKFLVCMLVPFFISYIYAATYKAEKPLIINTAKGKKALASGLIYVKRNEKIILLKPFGYSDYKRQKQFTPQTQIYIGSLKKQFVAAAILKLFYEGKLKLNDPVSKYLTFNRKLCTVDPCWIHTTTLHHLLTHTSNVNKKSFDDDRNLPFLDKVYMGSSSPSKPEEFSYNTIGFNLLELVIENVSNLTFSDYIAKEFLAPLKMNNTFFHGAMPPDEVRKKLSKDLCYPYYFDAKRQIAIDAYPQSEFRQFGNYDMVSTAEDLCTWNEALYSGRAFNIPTRDALKLFNIMSTPYVRDDEGESYYGYGIKSYIRNFQTIYWHEGLVTGASVYLEYDQKNHTHVVILCNNSGKQLDIESGAHILDSMIGVFE